VTALNNWLEHERLSGVTNDKLVLKLFKLLEPLPMTLEVLQRSSVGKTVKKFTASKYSPTIRKLAAKLIGDWMSLIEAKGTTVTPLQHYTPRHATSHTAISMPLATRHSVACISAHRRPLNRFTHRRPRAPHFAPCNYRVPVRVRARAPVVCWSLLPAGRQVHAASLP